MPCATMPSPFRVTRAVTTLGGLISVPEGWPITSASAPVERMVIEGEWFDVEREGRKVYLIHPSWSLMGVGRTPKDARARLLEEARALAVEMAADDDAILSPEAKRLRDFVTTIR